jgi:hypothetical protein
MRVFAEGIGVVGPGLENWPEARRVLAGAVRYEPRPVCSPPPTLLPPAERRRVGTSARLAIAAGIEALTQAGRDPKDMAMVFAASGGDGETVGQILTALATPQREVSPTRFHNSVHNAPAGYWSVATGSQAPSTSLSAFDDSFAAGMLEAVVQAIVQDRPVTLIACDVPYPEPLHAARPIIGAFAMALVLTPQRTARALAALTVTIAEAAAPATVITDPEFEGLRAGNPAARGLPLLAAIARDVACTIRVGGLDIAVAAP